MSCDLQMHVMDDVVETSSGEVAEVEDDAGEGEGGAVKVHVEELDVVAIAAATAAAAILIAEETVVTGKGVKIHHSDFSTRGKAPGDVYEPFEHVTSVSDNTV